ncbi:hypothetical protein SAMN05421784_1028 [Xenorhabdus koppenhoeferi]|uniref:Uncharacterized protein n=1 Tax=Xenorhabdus koppenhoeferi TaxID=351659 RepID=A0A1I7EVH9_9GAMM|nr:hypothetical protein SAMN05421784_1028 [Xenorhabdus koppenhoeferi]
MKPLLYYLKMMGRYLVIVVVKSEISIEYTLIKGTRGAFFFFKVSML